MICQATILEWPQIDALARAYFERLGRDYQERGENAVWFVARDGEQVVGCYSTQTFDDSAQIWIMDMYRIDGYRGARAICELYRHAYAEAKSKGFDVIITADPKNEQWIKAIERYGDAELVGLVYLKRT